MSRLCCGTLQGAPHTSPQVFAALATDRCTFPARTSNPPPAPAPPGPEGAADHDLTAQGVQHDGAHLARPPHRLLRRAPGGAWVQAPGSAPQRQRTSLLARAPAGTQAAPPCTCSRLPARPRSSLAPPPRLLASHLQIVQAASVVVNRTPCQVDARRGHAVLPSARGSQWGRGRIGPESGRAGGSGSGRRRCVRPGSPDGGRPLTGHQRPAVRVVCDAYTPRARAPHLVPRERAPTSSSAISISTDWHAGPMVPTICGGRAAGARRPLQRR
jgi:hypothetical protein